MSKLLKMNLQIFADEGDSGTDAETQQGDQTSGNEGQTDPEKTFTQADVDQIIKDRLAREKKGLPSKEELDDYTKWKESQQTEQEKTNAELERLRKENEDYKKKTSALEAKEKVLGKEVLTKYADFVVFSVQQSVTEDLDFDAALDKYLKENPQYIGEEQTTTTTGRRQGSSASKPLDDVAAEFAKRTGLKPKSE